MKVLRTLPTTRLVVLLGAVAGVLVVGVTLALAAGGSGPTPPAKALPDAIHDALTAPPAAGVTARISFTNGLLPSSALTGQAGSALISGASGRLWLTNDGRGRIELQSDAGDTQIVWNPQQLSVYDASSNTDYRFALPQSSAASSSATPPTTTDIATAIQKLGADWTLTGAEATDVAGRAAYDVRITPKGSGGLLGAAEIAWDALRGVPLKVAVYAKGVASPVLELTTTQISFGAVPASDVDVSPPAGATVLDVPTSGHSGATSSDVTGLAAVQAQVTFPIVAPDTLGGLPRTTVRLVKHHTSSGALIVYGEGLGAVAVLEIQSTGPANGLPGAIAALPTVSIGGDQAHELATPLGTVLTWTQASVETVLAGSITAPAAEADAAGLR